MYVLRPPSTTCSSALAVYAPRIQPRFSLVLRLYAIESCVTKVRLIKVNNGGEGFWNENLAMWEVHPLVQRCKFITKYYESVYDQNIQYQQVVLLSCNLNAILWYHFKLQPIRSGNQKDNLIRKAFRSNFRSQSLINRESDTMCKPCNCQEWKESQNLAYWQEESRCVGRQNLVRRVTVCGKAELGKMDNFVSKIFDYI